MLELDGDPDIFYSFLRELMFVGMNKGRAKLLEQYSINLDHSLRQTVAYRRALLDITKEKQ